MVVVLGDIVAHLLQAPLLVVSLVEDTRAHGKRGHANTRETEVVGAIVVSGAGVGIGHDGQPECLGRALDRGIEGGALGAGNSDFLRNPSGGTSSKFRSSESSFAGIGGCLP